MRIIIIGASRGIGRGLAQQLAEQGHQLLLVARDPERLNATRDEISDSSGNLGITAIAADLSEMHEVRRLCSAVAAVFPTFDILVNNHGGVFPERMLTSEGLEMNFALNYLSAFLLTNELLPLLAHSPGGRIVNIAAEAHRSVTLELDHLQSEYDYNSVQAYCRSKLMLIVFTRTLAAHLGGSGIDIVALHPGSLFTDALHTMRAEFTRLTGGTEFPQAQEVAAGIQPLLDVILEQRGDNGSYYVVNKRARPSEEACRTDLGAVLWEVSERLIQS